MVGIGTKTEKYVAASYSVANIDFDRLCDQVTSQGMVPRGIVKAVLDGMIDALCTYASIGATVRLGDFGSLRPGLNGKSQEDAKSVTADVVYRQKLIFVPGQRLKNMMKQTIPQRRLHDKSPLFIYMTCFAIHAQASASANA